MNDIGTMLNSNKERMENPKQTVYWTDFPELRLIALYYSMEESHHNRNHPEYYRVMP